MAAGDPIRPLDLHVSALSNPEYDLYTSSFRDLAADDGNDKQATDYDHISVGVREVRAWMRGRYTNVPLQDIDAILRLFCPNLVPTDVVTTGQFFAVMRLLMHVRSGKQVDPALVFIQAHLQDYPSRPQSPSQPELHARHNTSGVIANTVDPPAPDVLPSASQVPNYRTAAVSKASNALPSSSPRANLPPLPTNESRQLSTERPVPPPVIPPKSTTNPFLSRTRPPLPTYESDPNASPRVRAPHEGRMPPLPPRKPYIPPPRHSSQAQPLPSATLSTSNSNTLIQQSLLATRVAQSLKKAEERLESERVLEVLKSSSGVVRRVRSGSPPKDHAGSASSTSSSSLGETTAPVLPPRRISMAAASTAGSTRSFEQVATATVGALKRAPPRSIREDPIRFSPSPSRSRSPARSAPAAADTPPPVPSFPAQPPPTHPDRKLQSFPSSDSMPLSPSSPRVFRSKSLHHSAPPVPPPPRRRPESVQIAPGSPGSPADSPFASPAHSTFSASSTGAGAGALGRRLSLNRESESGMRNLQKTLSNLQQRAQPRLDAARYKAEAGLSRRGFVNHQKWMHEEGEERLIDGDDEGRGGMDDGEYGVGVLDSDADREEETNEVERKFHERMKMLKDAGIRGTSEGGTRDERGRNQSSERWSVDRDELKWPAGEGWKPL